MLKRTVLAIDQGTTGTTVVLFDEDGIIRARAYREVTQYFPQPGWVEHDPMDILTGVLSAVEEVLTQVSEPPIALGITNQRETIVVWDKNTGCPVHRAIVWQCRRTAAACAALRDLGIEPLVHDKTGLILDPYFSGSKLAWLLREVPGLAARAARGEVLAGTIDSWLAWHLTGRHVTDCTNASRTLLFNLHTLNWDDQLLQLFRIPADILPQVIDTSSVVGYTKGIGRIPAGIAVAALAGDQQAALFGQACFHRGMAKNTYGTGAFLLINTGDIPVFSQKGLLTTVAWRVGGRVSYCLEGSVFVAGAAIQWLRDGLGIIATAGETEQIASSVADAGGVVFVPAFVGLGTPYWDPAARGTILGITRGTRREHIVRACLEAIAHQSQDVLSCMAEEAVVPSVLRVDGGASANQVLMQMQADISGLEVHRPMVAETTALGAAMLAGLATDVWGSEEDLARVWKPQTVFRPCWDNTQREKARQRWCEAVQRARNWA